VDIFEFSALILCPLSEIERQKTINAHIPKSGHELTAFVSIILI